MPTVCHTPTCKCTTCDPLNTKQAIAIPKATSTNWNQVCTLILRAAQGRLADDLHDIFAGTDFVDADGCLTEEFWHEFRERLAGVRQPPHL